MTRARRLAGAQPPASLTSALATSADSPRWPEPRPGRTLARSFLLPALALLLGALSLFHAAPAAAQTIPSLVNNGYAAQITNFTVTAGNEKLTLSWTSGQSWNRGIWVQYKTSTATSWTFSRSSGESSPYEITNLTNDTAYNVRIFAVVCCNAGGDLIRSAFITGSGTPQIPAPAAPTDLDITPGNTQLSLTWVKPAGTVTGYDVHYTSALATGSSPVANDAAATGSDASAAWVAVTRTGATASQTISTLTNGTLYRVRVRAKNSGGSGPWVFGMGTPSAANTMTLSASSTTVTEGQTVTFTISLTSAATQVSGFSPIFSYDTRRITSENGDHDATHVSINPLRTTLFFPTGQTSDTFEIATKHEVTEDQEDETFSVTLVDPPTGYAIGSPSSVTITIVDDDKPSVSLSASPNPVLEGSSVTVTATLSHATVPALTIPVTLSTGTPNTAESGDVGTLTSITIFAGSTAGAGTVTTVQDSDSDDETFTVALGTTLPATVTRGTPDSVEITISEKPTVSLSASPNPVDEGSTVTVTATLSVALDPAAAVTIPLTVTSGTAETGDHGTLASISIASGETEGTGTISTSTDADTADETFTVALGTLPSSLAAGTSSVVVTIREPPGVSLSASPNPVGEGSSVTVTATLARALSAAVTIPLTVTSGSAEAGDHGTLTSITIAAEATTGTGAITANEDADDEDETFTVALGSSLPAAVNRGSPASVEITIDDDELPTVTLFAVPERVAEGSGLTVIAQLSSTLPTALTVPLTVTRGSAEPSDFTAPSSLTIEAGAPMGTAEISTHHDSDEDHETFTVALGSSLSATVAAGTPSSFTVQIVDDEGRPAVSLSASPNPVAEGSSVTLTATLSEALAVAVTIPLRYTVEQYAGDTAESDDYSAPSSIDIAAGETVGRARIRTTEDDDADNERFTVALGELPPEVQAGNPSQLDIEISDGQADVTVTLLVSSPTVAEGEAVELILRFSSPVPAPTQFGNDVVVRVTGTDTEDGDVRVGLNDIRVDEGRTSKTFTIDTQRDTDADDEHFTVSIEAADQRGWMEWLKIGSPSSVDVTIEDGASETGSVEVSLSAAPTIEEGTSADVTIEFSAPVPYQRWEEVKIPIEITRIDAEPSDVQEGTINKRVAGGQTESNHFVKTHADDDTDPDKFMVSVGTNLPDGMSAGSNSSVTITIVEYVPAESAPNAEPPGASEDVMVAVSGAPPEPTFVTGASDMTVDASPALAGEELEFKLASGDAEAASFDDFSAVAAREAAPAAPSVESVGEATVAVAASNPVNVARVTFAATVKEVSNEESEALGRSHDGLTRSLLAGAAGVIEKRIAASDVVSPKLEYMDAFATVAGLLGRHAPSIPVASGLASPDAGMVGFSSGLSDVFASPGELSPGGLASGSGLWNRSFAHALGSDDGTTSGLMVWGLGDVQRFGGGEGDARFDGEWRTAYLGADRRFGERWLGGVALALGRGEAAYSFGRSGTGTRWLRTELTAVYPYVRGDLTDGGELWAVLGAGTGTALSVGADNDDGAAQQGALSMRLAAAGLRRELGNWSAVRLSVLADGGAAALAVRGPAALASLDSTTHRLRGGMEVAGAGRLSPYLRLNARYDGGGEMAEAGLEGESGLRYAGPRVDFDLRARYMALAGNADYRESGATATLTIKAAPDGAGLTATLTPSWGRTEATDLVWAPGTPPSMGTAQSFAAGDDAPAMFNAQLGYGIDSRRLRGRLTPTLGYRRTGPGADALRFGADYVADPARLRRELAIGLDLQTLDRAWGAELRAEMRW